MNALLLVFTTSNPPWHRGSTFKIREQTTCDQHKFFYCYGFELKLSSKIRATCCASVTAPTGRVAVTNGSADRSLRPFRGPRGRTLHMKLCILFARATSKVTKDIFVQSRVCRRLRSSRLLHALCCPLIRLGHAQSRCPQSVMSHTPIHGSARRAC